MRASNQTLAGINATSVADDPLTDVYMPVVRGFLIALGFYYTIISGSHPFYEHGLSLIILDGLAIITAAICFGCYFALPRIRTQFWHLEAAALTVNSLMLLNVVAYQAFHFEQQKLVYFVLMSLAFATSSPSRRVAYPSIALSLAGLLVLARQADSATRAQYEFIGLAASFAAFGISVLMRGAIARSVTARLTAEGMTRRLEDERQMNDLLRERAEDLARREAGANRAKTEFLATITHELRTPLNGVMGMVQAMSNDPLEPAQRQRLEIVRGSGQALLQIINNVLDISKIEVGRIELSPVVFDLKPVVEDLGRLYAALATDKGLAFDLEVDPSADSWSFGDEVRLRQVLSNLLSNALKFTDQGGVTARVWREGDRLIFTVRDTGIGVPAEQAPRLFERFVQGDASTTRRFGGTGLGLAICREIVKLLDGEISFSSVPGEGSCFMFHVAMPSVPAPRAAAPAAKVEGEAAEDTIRVLVVDDNATNRLVLTTLLNQFDIANAAVDSGQAAIDAWETGGWDLILMDIHMPGMDGLTASKQIRAREQATGQSRTAIIAVTASVLSHETEAYFAAGMDDCIAKPIEIGLLLETIKRAVRSDVDPQAAVDPTRAIAGA
jgi:signal transduction histidine kinase/FixJ family two-component response regulator